MCASTRLQSRLDPGSPWCTYWFATVLDATAGLVAGVQFECGILHFVIKNMLRL